ncbi:G-protein coupled receptor 1-like [Miscanthus floridulus]|uniref:G-protein coupled receptor 1-like n=1 Tax=Miscanthus floridulus TaxID=154761 RepID=UPI00345A1E92
MAPAVAGAASVAMSQALRDRQILDAVGTGAAALSLVGSSFIVLCYLLFRELRKFSFKLVYYLAVSDMFCSLFTILGGPSNAFYLLCSDYSAHFFLSQATDSVSNLSVPSLDILLQSMLKW